MPWTTTPTTLTMASSSPFISYNQKLTDTPCGLTIILTSNSRTPLCPIDGHRAEQKFRECAMPWWHIRAGLLTVSGLPLGSRSPVGNWASFVSATRAATLSVPTWPAAGTSYHLVNVHWDLIVKQLVYRKFVSDLHFGNVLLAGVQQHMAWNGLGWDVRWPKALGNFYNIEKKVE